MSGCLEYSEKYKSKRYEGESEEIFTHNLITFRLYYTVYFLSRTKLQNLLRLLALSIHYIIEPHEIGHVILGHRNSILERQSKNEIRRQEMQADELARRITD